MLRYNDIKIGEVSRYNNTFWPKWLQKVDFGANFEEKSVKFSQKMSKISKKKLTSGSTVLFSFQRQEKNAENGRFQYNIGGMLQFPPTLLVFA